MSTYSQNTYLVVLNNGAEEMVHCSSWMVAPSVAIKQHRDNNPDAPDHLVMVDVKAIEADDMVTWSGK